MLLSAFQQSPLCGSSADAYVQPPFPKPLLPHPPPISRLPPPSPRQGRDGGITRQEQSSQRYSDRTGAALHADEEEER